MISKAEVNKEKLPSLHIKEDVIKKLTNSLLVIDEFQMCYSMEGWNTYGGTIKVLLEQVQDFTPTPMTLSSVIYYSGINPYAKDKVFCETDIAKKRQQNQCFF